MRNLNEQPDGWDIDDKSVDAILICVGIQYLQQPEKVFAEIFRVLKPGGVCIVTFSNRQFYDKVLQDADSQRHKHWPLFIIIFDYSASVMMRERCIPLTRLSALYWCSPEHV